jgi:hypothetical protein
VRGKSGGRGEEREGSAASAWLGLGRRPSPQRFPATSVPDARPAPGAQPGRLPSLPESVGAVGEQRLLTKHGLAALRTVHADKKQARL